MKTLAMDTSLEAERVQIELLRRVPPWRKFEMVAQLNQTVRVLMLEGLRQRYPLASRNELHRHLADLILGADVATRLYESQEFLK